MKILLDTNVWRRLRQKELSDLYTALLQSKYEVFLSETVFTLEAVPKKDRLNFFQNIKTESLKINPYLSKALEETKQLGIKILRTPRIGMFQNDDLPDEVFYKDADVHERMERIGKLSRHFDNAGFNRLVNFVSGLNIGEPWQANMHKISEVHAEDFARHVAEWADGDTAAACYGYNLDLICTHDGQSNMSSDAIFSLPNRQILSAEFGVQIKSADELTCLLAN